MNKEFLNKRYKKEKKVYSFWKSSCVHLSFFLVILLGSILLKGISGFYTTNIFLQTNLFKKL